MKSTPVLAIICFAWCMFLAAEARCDSGLWNKVSDTCTSGLSWGSDCPHNGTCPTVQCAASGKRFVFTCSLAGSDQTCDSTDGTIKGLKLPQDPAQEGALLCAAACK